MERRDDDNKDEQVVHREAVLGEITGEELAGGLASGDDGKADPERDGQAHGSCSPQGGLARADLVRIAKTEDQIAGDADHECGNSDEPDPQRDVHDFSPPVANAAVTGGLSRSSEPVRRALSTELTTHPRGDTPL